jgi:hypothetical protein
VDHIIALLGTMGDTPEAVAATLERETIRGLRGACCFQNPVVQYLNRHFDIGGRLEIEKGTGVLRIVREGKFREAPLPLACASFLEQFHQGLHPHLEDA